MASFAAGLFVITLLGIAVGFLVIIVPEILRGARLIWRRPHISQFDLAFLLTLVAAIAVTIAVREQVPVLIGIVASSVICWITRLFFCEVLSGTRYRVDRSLAQEQRRRSLPTGIDLASLIQRPHSPKPRHRFRIRHSVPQFTGRIVRIHF